ncbi:uncharacterized protein E0L32_010597 [Thyridium curvatum]|uniref:BHLH domain-containing protein n=1 Tax=Thyridium curvatum TaxID=1093900 RepID=A0A507AS40_9PEZI|nr:uncharacterized protein E0L32_010597 [Thyridium curvatum]TPX07701.1 hypothetical protein E0L32_010597 [Thyridium curvatum]
MNTNLFPTDLDLDLDMTKTANTPLPQMNMPFNGGYGATGWDNGLSYSPDVFIEDPSFDYFSMFSNNGASSNDFMSWPASQPYAAAAPTATSPADFLNFQDMDYLSESAGSPGEMTDSSSSRGTSRKHSRADDSDSSAAEEPVSPRTTTRPATKKSRPSPRFGKPSTKISKSSSSSKASSSAASETSSKPSVALRTAPRKVKSESSKSSPATPEDDLTAEEHRARQSHNLVEKKYRNRLNAQFEQLLAVLPADQQREATTSSKRGSQDADEKRMSKGDVLDLARRRIRALEQEKARLQAERAALLETASSMRGMTSPIMA